MKKGHDMFENLPYLNNEIKLLRAEKKKLMRPVNKLLKSDEAKREKLLVELVLKAFAEVNLRIQTDPYMLTGSFEVSWIWELNILARSVFSSYLNDAGCDSIFVEDAVNAFFAM